MEISIIRGTLCFIAGIANFLFASLFWIRGKNRATLHLGLAAFFSGLYNFAWGISYFWDNPNTLIFWARATWIGTLIIPELLIFIYYFTEREKNLKLKAFLWYFPGILFTLLALTTPYIVKELISTKPLVARAGSLSRFGRLYVIFGSAAGLYYLLKEYFKSKGFKKLQIKYFIVGVCIYAGSGFIFAGILPFLSHQRFNQYIYLSAISSVFWMGFSTYAIFQKALFGIKLILTEFLIGLMGVILAILPFLTTTLFLKILTTLLFLLFCLFGYFLIQATYQEEKKREEAEKLAIKERISREQAEKFAKISKELKEKLSQVLNLEEVASQISDVLAKAFQVDKICIAPKPADFRFPEVWKNVGFSSQKILFLLGDPILYLFLEETGRVSSQGEVLSLMEKIQDEIKKEQLKIFLDKLKQNEIEVLIPLFQREKVLVGVIILGKRISGEHYSKEDLEILNNLSYQFSISISNAIFFKKIQEDKEALEKFYKLIEGRELKMMELKEKIKELEQKLKEKTQPNPK